MNGIKMGVTTHIMDQNLSFIHDYRIRLISAPDISTRDISTWTFHHRFFLARVLFSSADVPANGHYVSKDIWHGDVTALGHFNIGTFRYSVEMSLCRNVRIAVHGFRNILGLKRTHTVMSHTEKSPCQKVPVPKCPRAEKSMCRKIPEWKSPLAEMSMEMKCSYAVTSTELKSPFCQNVAVTKCPC